MQIAKSAVQDAVLFHRRAALRRCGEHGCRSAVVETPSAMRGSSTQLQSVGRMGGPRVGGAVGCPDLLVVPTVHGGRERGDDNLAPLGGGVHRVLLGHEWLLRGSTVTRQRAPNPSEDGITNPVPHYCPIAPCLGLRSRRCQGQTGICLDVDSRLPRLVGTAIASVLKDPPQRVSAGADGLITSCRRLPSRSSHERRCSVTAAPSLTGLSCSRGCGCQRTGCAKRPTMSSASLAGSGSLVTNPRPC